MYFIMAETRFYTNNHWRTMWVGTRDTYYSYQYNKFNQYSMPPYEQFEGTIKCLTYEKL